MTSAVRLVVDRSYPEAWRCLPALPLLAGEPWHRAAARRFDGEPVWLWLPAAGDSDGRWVGAGLAGFVVSRPDAYVYGNAAAMLADAASPLAPTGVATALAAGEVDPGRLLPHLLLTYPGYSTFPVGEARTDPAALRRLLEAVLEWAAAQRLAAVALPYVEAGSTLAQAARATGFSGWRLTEDSYLDVPEDGFEGYLARFGSHRRRRIRAERRRLHERGLRGRRVEAVSAALLGRMAHLRVAHRRRYGLAGDLAAERRRLEEVVTTLGDRADVVVVEHEPPAPAAGPPATRSEPLSFALFARDGDLWHALAAGTDYDDPRSRSVYFEVAFYAPLEAAAGCGVRRISYGLAASEAKALRGCELRPVECLLAGACGAGRATVAAVHAAWTGTPPPIPPQSTAAPG